ncbi:MAG TPA: FtsX-like permease family protein, partial [Gemmatimonadales bacterium]|nr:FtsX-like permease family protein [Gemmatimonadales bacterium]
WFAVGLALLVALVVGLAPALRAGRIDLRGVLGDGGRGSTRGAGGAGLRRALVVVEVAVSAALLVSVALLLRSAVALNRVPPGFVTDSVVTARMALPTRNYPTGDNVSAAYQRIYGVLRSIPGPRAIAMISQVPLSNGGFGARFHQIEHAMTGTDGVLSNIRIASPGYFGAMGIGIVGGRDFSEGDQATAPPVIMVNETFVREMGWSGNPVGRLVHTEVKDIGTRDGKEVAFQVVGIVKDVQEWGLRQAPSSTLYLPITQAPPAPWEWTGRQMEIVARASGDPLALIPVLRSAVSGAEPGLPLYDVQTMGERLRASLALERTNTIVITALGLVALLLAAIGIYGVLAYGVRQRTGEIGIRMALGAEDGDIVRLVLGEGVQLALIGMLLGLPAAWGAARLLESTLFGIGSHDPLSFAVSGAVLLGATVLACLVPVRTALAVPPVEVLRG